MPNPSFMPILIPGSFSAVPETYCLETSNCPSYLSIPACNMLVICQIHDLRPPEVSDADF